MQLYDKIVHPKLLIKRITVTANHLVEESRAEQTPKYEQLDLFTDYSVQQEQQAAENADLEREKRMQKAMIDIKRSLEKCHIKRHES